MPDTTAASPPLTPRFERVLALDGPWFGRPKPTRDELEAIHGLIAQGVPVAKRYDLARAMAIAADNSPTPETAALIVRILNDERADLALRRQAATLLGEIPVRASAKALSEALSNSSPMFEAALLAALAKVGDDEAARAIAARPPTVSKRLARLREFARAMILYRDGRQADERADKALLPIGQDVTISREPAAEVSKIMAGLRGSTFGVRIEPALGYAFQCGSTRQVVLLSADLPAGPGLLAALSQRRRIAGIVAMQDERGSATYVVHRIVVTRPERDGIAVAVLSTGGEVELRGMLVPRDKGATLSLRSHAAGRRPIEVEGVVSDEGLVLRARVFLDDAAAKRSGDVDPAAA